MAEERELERILMHLFKAVAHLDHCPGDEKLDRTIASLRKRIDTLKAKREELLLKEAREESQLQYRWSWWAYPEKRGNLPSLLGFSPTWHDYRVDAVNAACKGRTFRWKRGLFYVCHLQTRAEGADVLSVTECMTPWKDNGQLPLVAMQTHPMQEGASMSDAVYAAREQFKYCDEWDGPQGMKFILLESGGCEQ